MLEKNYIYEDIYNRNKYKYKDIYLHSYVYILYYNIYIIL